MKRKMGSTSTVARDPITARRTTLAAANAAAASAAAGSLHPHPPQFTRLLDHGGVTVARTPGHGGAAATSLPLRTARPPDLGWIEAAAAAARPFTAGSRPRPLLDAADSSSAATRPRPSSSDGFRSMRQTVYTPIPISYAAPSGSGPPTGVPLPDLSTMVDELEKDLSRMRCDLSVTLDKANRKLESVEALHEFQKTKELAMGKKMDTLNAKILELEGVIKVMQAEDSSSTQDKCKGKHAAMHRGNEADLLTELNYMFQTLEVMLSTLEHACHCNMHPCAKQYCGGFKRMLVHVSNCLPQPKERDCADCKNIIPLLSMHSRICTSRVCTLLFCKDKNQARKSVHGRNIWM